MLPTTSSRFGDPEILRQAVVPDRVETEQFALSGVGDPLQEVRREEAAFGTDGRPVVEGASRHQPTTGAMM